MASAPVAHATLPALGLDRDLRGAHDKRLVQLDDHIKASLKAFGVSGAAAAVVVNQKIVYAKGFGNCMPGESEPSTGAPSNGGDSWFKGSGAKEVPVDGDSVFQLGKSGDALISVLIGSLIEEGTLQYDTTIQSLLSNFSHPQAFATPIITVGDVLSHRSGLPSTKTSIGACLASEIPLASFPASLAVIPAKECPAFRGISVRSHLNTILLGCVASKVMRGVPIEMLVKERVWDRCGASLKSGYVAEGKDDISQGATSTVKDTARLLCSLAGGWGPMAAASLKSFWSAVGIADQQRTVEGFVGADESQGLAVSAGGWSNSIYRGRRRVGFGSNGTGGLVEGWVFPELGYCVVVMATKSSHLPTAIANLASDYLLEASAPTAWIEKLNSVPASIPLPGEIPADMALSGDPSVTVNGTQAPIRPFIGYAGLYVSSVAPTIGFKITTDTTSLVAAATIAGTKIFPPTLLASSQIDTFTFQVRNLRPCLKRFVSHQAVLHFRSAPDGTIEGVSVHSVAFENLKSSLGPALFFPKVSNGGPAVPQPNSALGAAGRTSSVTASGNTGPTTAAAPPALSGPSLPPRRRQASQGSGTTQVCPPQAQAPIVATTGLPSPLISQLSETASPISTVRRPPPPLPPSRRESSNVLPVPQPVQEAQPLPASITEVPPPVQPSSTVPSVATAASIAFVTASPSASMTASIHDLVPPPPAYDDNPGNAWACPTPPLPTRTQPPVPHATQLSSTLSRVENRVRSDSVIAAAEAVAASDKPTEEIEEEVGSDMKALDDMFDDLGIGMEGEGGDGTEEGSAAEGLLKQQSELDLT
ncbi:hypothetical protein HDU67_002166 [Dinochytrium kinnereticum]|nr:hypothetical protein HDU67_002166 [Dinochytrium kinnereticum]